LHHGQRRTLRIVSHAVKRREQRSAAIGLVNFVLFHCPSVERFPAVVCAASGAQVL